MFVITLLILFLIPFKRVIFVATISKSTTQPVPSDGMGQEAPVRLYIYSVIPKS